MQKSIIRYKIESFTFLTLRYINTSFSMFNNDVTLGTNAQCNIKFFLQEWYLSHFESCICQHFHPPVDIFINTSCSKQYLQDKYRNYVSKSFTVLFLFNYNNIIDYKCFEIHNEMLCNFAFQKRTHQRMSNIYVLSRTNFSIQYQH